MLIMKKIVGVKFDNVKQIFCYDPNGLRVYKNSHVIARRDGNLDFGIVVNIREYEKNIELPKLIRFASFSDRKKNEANKKFELEALKICKDLIKKYAINMKLISTKVTFDAAKIIFYFVADKRIDFRLLVKELSKIFKAKIEMKQLGVRDEARYICSMGICGRSLCCNRFVKEFDTVSIKMAKDQGVSLSPMKISGSCGRLLCCLKYEQDVYEDLNKNIPQVNSMVKTPDGIGKVLITNVLLQTVKVVFIGENPADTVIKIYPLEQVESLPN